MISQLLFANLRDQPLQFVLATLLCTLGLASVNTIVWLQKTLESHAARQATGIDLVVGAKGSALQNTLAAVYHLDVPNGNIRLADVEALAKHPMVMRAIPISLGDSVGGARIVGATPAVYELYAAKANEGMLPAVPLEAAIGANAAKRLKLNVGDRFVGNHGLSEGGDGHGDHAYLVTAILKPTGRVIDELVITPLESVWAVHADHAASTEREVTFALLQLRGPVAMATLPRYINSQTNMQAASPAAESARLLANFGWVAIIVKAFAVALIVAAFFALFVALLQALDRRKTDLALLRAMGVKRGKLWTLLLGESLMVIFLAGAIATFLVIAAAFWLRMYGIPGIHIDWGHGVIVILSSMFVASVLAILATLPVVRRTFTLDISAQLSRT
jgi:putative ABC transport system permease protein